MNGPENYGNQAAVAGDDQAVSLSLPPEADSLVMWRLSRSLRRLLLTAIVYVAPANICLLVVYMLRRHMVRAFSVWMLAEVHSCALTPVTRQARHS